MKKNAQLNLLLKADHIVKALVIVGVFTLIAVLAHNALHDLDIWLHLKAGEYIVQQKIVPIHDIFSFTLNGAPWVDHEWLFQVFIYLVNFLWQADGLIFVQSLAVVSAFLILFIISYRTTGLYLESAVLTLVAAYASISRFNIRPDVFSLIFFGLYLYILKFYRQNKLVWLLVPIQIIWVNSHGYFFLGPFLVFLFILAEYLRRNIKKLPWKLGSKEGALNDATYLRLRRLLAVLILAGFLNPGGAEGAMYPLYIFKQLIAGENKIFFQYIQELQSTFGANRISQLYFFYILSGSCLAAMVVNWRRLKIIDILMFFVFLIFSFRVRNVAFFAFICCTILSTYFIDTLNILSSPFKTKVKPDRRMFLIIRFAIAGLFLILIYPKIQAQLRARQYDIEDTKYKDSLTGINQDRYPKAAVDFIMANDIPERMFNDFNSGAYLIGRCYPERKVFIDGRTELYGQDFFHKYIEAMAGNSFLFNELVNYYKIEAVLLSSASLSLPQIVSYIYKSPEWKMVFFDESGVVFLKDIPRNQELIKKYKVDFTNYKAPAADLRKLGLIQSYPRSYMKRANSFDNIKENNAEISESLEALRIMPNCAEGYNYLGKAYRRQKEYDKAFFNFRAACILSGGNLDMRLDLAGIFISLKDTKSARGYLKGIIRANPKYAPAYFMLGRTYLADNDENNAIKMLKKAVKIKPDNPEYLYKFAEALFIKGSKDKDMKFILQAKDELNKSFGLASLRQDEKLLEKIKNKLQQIVGKRE